MTAFVDCCERHALIVIAGTVVAAIIGVIGLTRLSGGRATSSKSAFLLRAAFVVLNQAPIAVFAAYGAMAFLSRIENNGQPGEPPTQAVATEAAPTIVAVPTAENDAYDRIRLLSVDSAPNRGGVTLPELPQGVSPTVANDWEEAANGLANSEDEGRSIESDAHAELETDVEPEPLSSPSSAPDSTPKLARRPRLDSNFGSVRDDVFRADLAAFATRAQDAECANVATELGEGALRR